MDKNRKIALITLSVFSVAIIIIWGINLRNNLRSPFSYKGEVTLNDKNKISNSCVDGNCSANEITSDNLELKKIDTDGDGISDWDELFIYGTSPYLEDTDGDGLSDYEELFSYKTDPNCPEGQTCSNYLNQTEFQDKNSSTDDDFLNLLNSLDSEDSFENSLNSSVLDNSLTNTSSINLEAQVLRRALIEGGIKESDLQQISDIDLIKLYQEISTDL